MIVRPLAPPDFLAQAGPWLEARETEHHLFFRIAGRFVNGIPPDRPAPFFAVVEAAGTLVAAAAMTPPYPLVISNASADARRAIMAHLEAAGITLSGVNGHAEASTAFAREWGERHGGEARIGMRLGVYEATRVEPPAVISGGLREMEPGDVDRVASWLQAFAEEALGADEHMTPEQALAGARDRLGRHMTYLWADPGPRTMASATGPSPHGMCINAVYTPAGFRRKGYASSCVAALTQRLLTEGRRFVCLFTDLTNPTSNSIYQKIGYRKVCEFADWKFSPPA